MWRREARRCERTSSEARCFACTWFSGVCVRSLCCSTSVRCRCANVPTRAHTHQRTTRMHMHMQSTVSCICMRASAHVLPADAAAEALHEQRAERERLRRAPVERRQRSRPHPRPRRHRRAHLLEASPHVRLQDRRVHRLHPPHVEHATSELSIIIIIIIIISHQSSPVSHLIPSRVPSLRIPTNRIESPFSSYRQCRTHISVRTVRVYTSTYIRIRTYS